ncbi:BH0509 family protein [Priestia megaterium]|nr:BH0509 family protein [Priestia megaterium]
MSRQERKNMITFIEKMKGFDRETLMYMTDADVEYIYTSTYQSYEEQLDM